MVAVTGLTELAELEAPVAYRMAADQGGRYRISAIINDEEGRENTSELTRWISGGQHPPDRKLQQQDLMLVPDKNEYMPGDTARILVQAPFFPAEGLLSVRRSGLLYTEQFTINGASHTLDIPVTSTHIPNLPLRVDLVGASSGASC